MMVTFLLYLTKSAIGLLLFYVCFKVFLSRETFFRFNRFILLGGMCVCMLLPFLRIQLSGKAKVVYDQVWTFDQNILKEDFNDVKKSTNDWENTVTSEIIPQEILVTSEVAENQTEATETLEALPQRSVSWRLILWIIYWSGALFVCVWLGMAFIRMRKLLSANCRKSFGEYTLVIVEHQICPFSWGRYIVISENDYNTSSREILTHEKIHADRKHTWDLCFTMLLLVIQWFNPAIWLLKKELQDIHEYEADNGVINQGIDATQYQLLLVKKAVGARLYSIANSFNHSKLKSRITMMLKEKSNRWARLKLLLLLPPAALLMFAFARPAETEQVSANAFKVTQIPEKTEKWTEDFFRQELIKNGETPEQIERQKMHEKYGSRWIEVLVGKTDYVFIGANKYSFEQVRSALIGLLKKNLDWKPLFITVQSIPPATQKENLEILQQIGEAYKEIRAFVATQSNDQSEQYLDKVCPIMVRVNCASEPLKGEVRKVQAKKAVSKRKLSGLQEFKQVIGQYNKQDTLRVMVGYQCQNVDKLLQWLTENGYTNAKIGYSKVEEQPYIYLRWEGPQGASQHMSVWNIEDLERQLKTDERYKKATTIYFHISRMNDANLKDIIVKMLKEHGVPNVKMIPPPPPFKEN